MCPPVQSTCSERARLLPFGSHINRYTDLLTLVHVLYICLEDYSHIKLQYVIHCNPFYYNTLL